MKKLVLAALALVAFFNVNAQKSKTVSRDWTSFAQQLNIVSKKEKKFKITASVKVVTEDETAWAALFARVDNKEGGMGFFDNMGDRPIKSNKWESYTIECIINSNSKQLSFGGICIMNGKFYFDNYKLFIENDKGLL